MKVRIEATPDELRERGTTLLEHLAKAFAPHDDAIAEALVKATPRKEPLLKHQALRDQHVTLRKRYQTTLDMMISEIGDVLESRIVLAKAESTPNYLANVLESEAESYDRIRADLSEYGYEPAAYGEGGRLFGASTNALRELLRTLKKQAN